jgi:integrase
MKAAHRTYSLPHLATEGVGNFDISEHETYTEEEPNSLLPGEVPEFLRAMQESYPQHYAMVYLGLATGLRPSSLRPLRRNGPTPDILWDDCKLLVRRSHSLGEEVMNTTKQRVRYRIHLPPEVMDVLRWHVRTQLTAPEQQESDLLFPSVTGSFRAASVLNKPLADVARAIGLNKRFTQCGLRRTFNDLARAAEVQSIVTRSISGHLTQQMQQHYSTVNADEQRESIGKVIGLMQARDRGARTASGGAQGGAQGSASGAQTKKAG